MIHKYKSLTDDDIRCLTAFVEPYILTKFDIIVNAVDGGTQMSLEELENNFGLCFEDDERSLLSDILKNHGFLMLATVRTSFVKRAVKK